MIRGIKMKRLGRFELGLVSRIMTLTHHEPPPLTTPIIVNNKDRLFIPIVGDDDGLGVEKTKINKEILW